MGVRWVALRFARAPSLTLGEMHETPPPLPPLLDIDEENYISLLLALLVDPLYIVVGLLGSPMCRPGGEEQTKDTTLLEYCTTWRWKQRQKQSHKT